jgi:hexosaminidase
MLAALAAYPELGCTGGPYEVWGMWGVADDVLCVGKEHTMQFLEDVLSEVCDLFPAEYVHIGGDECPKVRWENCPHCQAKIAELGLKDDEKYQAEHYLQGYVTARMEKFLAQKGKKLIGWDEILEGELAPNATVMSWRGVAGGLQAVRMGHDAIMTPNTYFYLDYYQSLDKENEPLAIGGYLPVEKCYSYEPTTADMTDEEKAHILGVQANLWTEYIPTADQLHYMLLPRLAALAEVQWCQPEVKDYQRFIDSADDFCAIYDIMGYKYGTHIFDANGKCTVNKEKGCVVVELEAQGDTPIRYTLDGSEPGPDSPLYSEPIEIRESCTLKAKSDRPGMGDRIWEKNFSAHKAMGRPVETLTETHPNYTFSCPDLLTDGLVSDGPYNSGDYAGWYNQPFEAIIDMGGAEYSEVTLSTIVFKYDWIFNAKSMTLLTSEDGENFTEVAKLDIPVEGMMDDGNGCKDHTLTFAPTSAKYLKVVAECTTEIPEWHPGAGKPSFIFVDEIIVK